MDQVDDVQAHIQEIKADLAAGNTAPYREFLNTAIEEAREETAVEVAKVLKSQLDIALRKPSCGTSEICWSNTVANSRPKPIL